MAISGTESALVLCAQVLQLGPRLPRPRLVLAPRLLHALVVCECVVPPMQLLVPRLLQRHALSMGQEQHPLRGVRLSELVVEREQRLERLHRVSESSRAPQAR